MSTAGKQLPPELLSEMVSTMPAGICFLGGTDFMKRMQPLSAFIRPRIREFQSKGDVFARKMELHKETSGKQLQELKANFFVFMIQQYQLGGQADMNEFARQSAAYCQQDVELATKNAEFLKKGKAWERSIEFAKKLAAGDKADNKGNGQNSGNDAEAIDIVGTSSTDDSDATGKKKRKKTSSLIAGCFCWK